VFAWAGAALFGAALLYFLYAYLILFGRPGDGGALAVTWDVALFTIFALHHSVFARAHVRDRVARLAPAHLERAVYVWIASLLFVGVCALWRPVAGVLWDVDGAPRVALAVMQVLGAYLTLRSAAVIGVWQLAGVQPMDAAITGDFTTAGPYGWVRHPIYSGWLLLVFAVSPMTGTRLVFAVVSSVYLLIAIPFEERSLRAASRGAYDAYMRRVRWKVIPRVY
jgi:protein-S-isoprenylcysteine O-methyltransferase Ste14